MILKQILKGSTLWLKKSKNHSSTGGQFTTSSRQNNVSHCALIAMESICAAMFSKLKSSKESLLGLNLLRVSIKAAMLLLIASSQHKQENKPFAVRLLAGCQIEANANLDLATTYKAFELKTLDFIKT